MKTFKDILELVFLLFYVIFSFILVVSISIILSTIRFVLPIIVLLTLAQYTELINIGYYYSTIVPILVLFVEVLLLAIYSSATRTKLSFKLI